MRMRWALVVGLVVGLVAGLGAASQASAKEVTVGALNDICQDGRQQSQALCAAYIRGLIMGVMSARIEVAQVLKARQIVSPHAVGVRCPRHDTDVMYLISKFKYWLKTHPDHRDQSAFLFIFEAVADDWDNEC